LTLSLQSRTFAPKIDIHMQKIILFFTIAFLAYACAPEAKEAAENGKEEVAAATTTQEEEEPVAITFPADSVAPDGSHSFHGMRISNDGAQPIGNLVNMMDGNSEIVTKLEGTVEACCQNKGCWMTMKLADGSDMRVRFQDYGFFVPKDAGGKIAVIEGTAFTDTTSVDDLRHYAEDAGQSQEEIEKITEPEISIGFLATGVIIKDPAEATDGAE